MEIEFQRKLAQILRTSRVAALGTFRGSTPAVSMVVFAPAEDFSAFYIYISQLSQHAQDIQKDKHVNLMIAENDDGREDPQTLARISIRGVAEYMPVGVPGYMPAKDLYLARFPKAEQLFGLTGFGLWRILPRGARYVAGYASAFNVTPEALQEAAQV